MMRALTSGLYYQCCLHAVLIRIYITHAQVWQVEKFGSRTVGAFVCICLNIVAHILYGKDPAVPIHPGIRSTATPEIANKAINNAAIGINRDNRCIG